jgi:outer membrane protein assembly factor BamB
MKRFLAVAWVFASLVWPAAAQEWPRFRGPNGGGVSATSFPTRWTDKDLLWKIQLPGHGHSSPVLWGKRLFITCGEEKTGNRIVMCLDGDSGTAHWTKDFAGVKHGKHADNSFASATPAVDDKHVYVTWGGPKEYLIVALGHDGNEKWRRDLGPFKAGHGFGASPIVHEDAVIIANDQDGKSSLVALDRHKGDDRWHVPRKGRSSYATPVVFQPKDGEAQLIFTNYEHGVTSIVPKTGKINWEVDIFNKGHVESAIGSPVVDGDFVYATCGWLGVRKEVIAVKPDVKTGKAIFTLEKNAPLVTTPIVVGDLLFLWSDQGVVTCADARTGKMHYQERVPGSYYSSPVCAGKHLYCLSREGDVVVIAANKKFELVAQVPLGAGSHATPAIANGIMYLRTFTHLMALSSKRS